MTTNMILINSKRVELHPDFSAALIAKWRAGWASLLDPSEVVRRAEFFSDNGFDIDDAIVVAKQQVIRDAVLDVSTPFWKEFQLANVLKPKAGSKPTPTSASSVPTP